jgi:hypothetical protein
MARNKEVITAIQLEFFFTPFETSYVVDILPCLLRLHKYRVVMGKTE